MEVNQNSLSPLLKPRFEKETITREQEQPRRGQTCYKSFHHTMELLPLALTLLATLRNQNRVKCTQFQAHVWLFIHWSFGDIWLTRA